MQRYLFKRSWRAQKSKELAPPQQTRCQKYRLLNKSAQAKSSHDPTISFSKAKAYVFVWAKKMLNLEKPSSLGPGSTIHGAGDQAPWAQAPQTQCLRPRPQANHSACFSFNESTLCAPYMLTTEPVETSESSRGRALPRLPALGSKTHRETPMQLLELHCFFTTWNEQTTFLPRSENF